MQLILAEEMTVKELQKQFTELFPFLQVQFYRSCADTKVVKVSENEKLRNLVSSFAPDVITLKDAITVAELQYLFRERGFSTQLFRKFDSFWIVTSLTDDWTLERQDREARLLSGG